MATTSELMTDATDASDKESIAVRNFAYAIAYHCKTAELVAVESPDERGRRVFAAIADEYRYLARFLLTSSKTAMEAHYAIKCDLIEKVKKGSRDTGKGLCGRRRTQSPNDTRRCPILSTVPPRVRFGRVHSS